MTNGKWLRWSSSQQKNLQPAGVDEEIGAFDTDTGYFSEENVSHLEGEQIDAYIATERLKHHGKIPLERWLSTERLDTQTTHGPQAAYEEGL